MPDSKLASIIVPIHNELDYTKLCIESIYRYTAIPFELIIIDNASTDRSTDYAKEIAGATVITNDTNLGYVKAVNKGIKKSSGDYVLLIDNDTIVTTSWLENLFECIESESTIGVVGPCTNQANTSQLINVSYQTTEQLQEIAAKFNEQESSCWFEVNELDKFCMLIKREVIESVGLFDEDFSLGFFAGKDFCRRAQIAGYRMKCAANTLVHHFGGRTYKNIDISTDESVDENKELFNKKWGSYSNDDNLDSGVINLAPTVKVALYTKMKLALEKMEGERGPLTEQLHKGMLFYYDKRYFTALQFLQDLADKLPESSHVQRALCFTLIMAGEFEKAQPFLESLLKENPEDYDLLCTAGDCYIILGEPDRAKSYFKRAVKVKGSLLSAQMGLLAVEKIKTHPKSSRFVNSMDALINFKCQLAKDDNRQLFVTYITVHHGVAGGSKVIFEQANRLIERGHTVKIVSHWPSPEWFDLHADVIKVPFSDELYKYVPEDTDVVIGTFWTQMLDLAKASHGARMFYAQGDQNIFEKDESRRTPDYRQDIQALADKNQFIPVPMFTVSSGLSSLVKKYYDRESDVIPGAIDTSLFKPFRRKKDGKTKLLMVGAEGLIFKGLHYINKAFQKVKEKRDVEIVWVAPQPRKSNQIQCDTYVEKPSQTELGKIYANCDVFVSASIYDAFPLPPLEAMACGTPVVTTINEGTLTYIKDGENCIAVPVRDADAIASAVEKILDDDLLRERLIKGGFDTSGKYTWDNAIDVLEEKMFRMSMFPNLRFVNVLSEERDDVGLEISGGYGNGHNPEFGQLLEAVTESPKKVLCVGIELVNITEELKMRGATEIICIDDKGELAHESAGTNNAADRMIGVDLNDLKLDYPEGYFDCIVVHKTVERLFNPWHTMSVLRTYLSSKGRLVCDIYNAGHISVVRNLLNGSWQYSEKGIQDIVNLRFFTRESIFSLLMSAGFSIEDINTRKALSHKDKEFLEQLELSHIAGEDFLDNAKYDRFTLTAFKQVSAIHSQHVKHSDSIAQSNKPKLSLAMIVKNEADNLARCLNSVQGVVDEIVIVDTGSTDNTVEIAKSFNAKVLDHVWQNDFSLARNVSLDNATGEWVMFLDADEELVVDDIDRLREMLDSTEAEGFFFNLFSFIGDKPDDGVVVNMAFRMWRNHPEYRFSGALHEQILAKVQSVNSNIEFSDIRINHYGYLNKAIAENSKPDRNINILKKEIEKHPGDAFMRFNLGVEYLRIKDFEKALVEYKKAFANLTGLDAAYASLLVRNICQCLHELKRYDEALSVLKDAQDAYPNYTDLFYIEGQIWMAKNKPQKAIERFKHCMDLGNAGREYISQAGVGSFMAANQLAKSYRAIGDEKAAVIAYKTALNIKNRDHVSVLELGTMLVDRENPSELQSFLESIVDMSYEDNLFALSAVFSNGGKYDLGLEYLDKLPEHSSKPAQVAFFYGECLLNLKRYEEAVEYFDKIPTTSRFFKPAILDTAVCHILEGAPQKARKKLNKLKVDGDYKLLVDIYLALVEITQDKTPKILIKKKQHKESEQIISNIMRKLLELEEFDVFERTVGLLSLIGLPEGHTDLLLGKIYYNQGYGQMAVELLIKAYGLGVADGEAFFMLGKEAFSNSFFEEAKIFFLEALAMGVDELTIYISLVRVLIRLNELENAMKYLDEGIDKYPISPLLVEIKNSISSLPKDLVPENA